MRRKVVRQMAINDFDPVLDKSSPVSERGKTKKRRDESGMRAAAKRKKKVS